MKITIPEITNKKTGTTYSATLESVGNTIFIKAEITDEKFSSPDCSLIKSVSGFTSTIVPIFGHETVACDMKKNYIVSMCSDANSFLMFFYAKHGRNFGKDLVKRYIFGYTKEELKKLN